MPVLGLLDSWTWDRWVVPKRPIRSSVRCVTFQKGEDLVYAAAKAWSHSWRQYLPLKCRDLFIRLHGDTVGRWSFTYFVVVYCKCVVSQAVWCPWEDDLVKEELAGLCKDWGETKEDSSHDRHCPDRDFNGSHPGQVLQLHCAARSHIRFNWRVSGLETIITEIL